MDTLKRPRGRPPVPDPATARLELRLTPAEKARYAEAARREGVPLTVWLKTLADREVAG